MERRRFTREFKLEAVRLRDRGVSCAQASQDLEVHPTQLRHLRTIRGMRSRARVR
jgi:transposase-like protein